ncbi:MAG: restriction endonuclease [Planctomycetes bacterium HGW-Planctomycetes-1]|nr:MAG: restriction endonuclease [Planctomycetes bacterium HGW-Planctomycetes-1]
MAIWLVRAGSRGQQQEWALDKGQVVIGWSEMETLSQFNTREEMLDGLRKAYPDALPARLYNYQGQLWAFAKRIKTGDLVILPLKGQDAIAIGKVTGDYKYRPENPRDAKHTRDVDWIQEDISRSRFDQDLLYSFGAFMTVCQIKRNNAEERIKAILEGKTTSQVIIADETEEVSDERIGQLLDLADNASTQIRSWIAQKFTGHQLADLVNAILESQGYVTEVSKPGPDGGVDIIAGRGPMGFDPPRLLVQVKGGDTQQDIKILRELKGIMKDFRAEQGLLVAWGGFKRTVIANARQDFFEIRIWDAGDVVENVLRYYESFPEEIKAELPLKRIWVLVQETES